MTRMSRQPASNKVFLITPGQVKQTEGVQEREIEEDGTREDQKDRNIGVYN